jgi:hypothetical protein
MINKREAKRFSMKFGKFFDPLGLFLLIAFFILPTLAVINLSPQTKSLNNVLGTQSKKEVSTVLIGGVHEYIVNEKLAFKSQDFATYTSKLLKREAGEYSKPILQLQNTFSQDAVFEVSGGTQNPTGATISILLNGIEYVLQDSSGTNNTISITLPKNSKNDMYLRFNTQAEIQFSEDIEINLVQK